QSFTVAHSFGANGTPMGVLVDEEGRIASEVAAGAPAVMALARGEDAVPEAAVPAAAQAAKRGEPAPPVRLPDLDGRTVELADFRGTKTLVLFWNPGCGFCQQMLADLKAWEAARPENAPNIVVVSSGGTEEIRAMGLRSPVLVDQTFAVGQSFGANGTPMAVLVDEQGNVASDVAVGAEQVLALARGVETGAGTATS
ncbi:MAG: TlpA family protein disulfide reductase, partial [Actinomycetota bacterium]|nr:TlpA family protein disulfide reductase [Actinomycetota bacterium]